MKSAIVAILAILFLSTNATALEPIFVPIKIDGPEHNPAEQTFWYGPFSEGCAVIDVNGDGKLDITSGQNWYEAPDWKKHTGLRPGAERSGEFISNSGEYAVDLNKDGKLDLISSGWMTEGVYWYENSGKVGEPWKETKIAPSTWTEGLIVEDIDGDDDVDVLISHWGAKPDQGVTWVEQREGLQWVTHIVGQRGDYHGIGLGDINMDGRKDIVTPHGWYEAPENRSKGIWNFHDDYKCESEVSIRMIVTDVNEDGLNDIIYGHGHNYGLFWLEQTAGSGGSEGRGFKRHVIEDSYSQLHTLVLGDVNQDGKLDLVTGKRLRGHGDDDPGSFDPLFVFWYDIQGGKFERHILSYNNLPHYDRSGIPNPVPNYAIGTGMNILVVDMTGDGRNEVIVAGKSGIYMFLNRGLPPTERMRQRRQ